MRIKRADLPGAEREGRFHACKRNETASQTIPSGGRRRGAEDQIGSRKDREIILAEAYRESEELRGGGDAKAFKIYADAYRQDPHFFEFTRTMEAYRKTLKDKTTILVSPTRILPLPQATLGRIRPSRQSRRIWDRYRCARLPAFR